MSTRPRFNTIQFKRIYGVLTVLSILLSTGTLIRLVTADSTPQTLPFSQDWTNTALVTLNDNWSGCPGVEGYLGQDITTATGTDPQTLVGVSSVANDLTVLANQTSTAITNGDVAEFHTTSQAGAPGSNSTIAIQGSGTADAPYVLLYLNTTGQSGISIAYNLRDIDCTTDNAIQPVALQYRVGSSGNFTNLPAGFVSDATTGPSLCTQVTPMNVALPAAVNNQPLVQVRIMTTNAVGNDEWVGVDDISVTSGVAPLSLSINDLTQTEGNAGTSTFSFTVSLNAPAGPGGVTFDIATQDNTATIAGNDYVAKALTGQTIPSGGSTYTFDVTVNGDTTVESNESFFVNVTNVTGAVVSDGQGLGTITNDDVTLTAIHNIQGNGSSSPIAGTSVTTTGIVTGLKSGSSGGFFIQEPDASVDADPNTSEGIFVFTGSSLPPAAVIGNMVQVSGNVQEFIPSADPNQNPLTEISGSLTVSLLSTGNPLPAVVTITPSMTTDPSGTSDPLDTLEEFEGMRVTVPSMVVVAPTQGSITESSATVNSNGVFYGVVLGVNRPFREAGIAISDPIPTPTPNPNNIPRFDENPERIRVDSDAQPGTTVIDVPAGTVITNITGPLDYAFRTYTILPEAATPPGVPPLPTASPVPTPLVDEMMIASFNMQRFFDTVNDPNTSDPVLTTTAFNNRLNKASLIIRNVMRMPEVIGVIEMENLSTLQTVATKVNNDAVLACSPNPNYTAYLVEGNDVGGIDVGFLVKGNINVISVTQLELASCDHVTPSTCYNFTNPNNGQLDILNDRPPLVLEASIVQPDSSVLPFTVIVNHLRSLSGIDDPVDGNRIRTKRRAQAEFLANYIQTRQAGDPLLKLVTLGDYNAFDVNDGYVDLMGTIKGNPTPPDQVLLASPDLVNPNLFLLSETVPADQRYSFTFDGSAQELDHILASNLMRFRFTRLAFGRTDADFPQVYYEDPSRPERLSDHDPAVAYFSLNMAPSAANGTIVGRITDGAGMPVAGAVINLTGTQTRKTITDANGNYQFDGVETNGFYLITPSRANFNFSPVNRAVSQLGQRTEASFAGTSQTEIANPLDTAEYFVRQQYLDVLGREPDEGGFNYWSDQILGCANDRSCVNARRQDVAAAFFIEAEFQRTGSYLYGLYKGALGRLPLYQEFSADRQQLIDGPNLDQNKQGFAENFVRRTEFMTKYSANVMAESFVDALLTNVREASGIDLTAERNIFINSYNSGTTLDQSRSLALRAIVESQTFRQAEYNGAFVLTEYFGYLRRDPDIGGYAFWLDVLNNRVPGNYRGMVCSFITSREYQLRFGSLVNSSNADCGQQ